MVSSHKQRQAHRAEYLDPINYTCGECGRVHEFDKEKPYQCELIVEEEKDGSSDSG